VQVDPIKPKFKLPGTKRLKLKRDEPLSNFAFKFKLRRYNEDDGTLMLPARPRGWHQSHAAAAGVGYLASASRALLKLLAVLALGVMTWPAATTAFALMDCQYQAGPHIGPSKGR
jgi:hypothetical protein